MCSAVRLHPTCDGVRVIVPGLLCDVEDLGHHCSGPAGQFAVTNHGEEGGKMEKVAY